MILGGISQFFPLGLYVSIYAALRCASNLRLSPAQTTACGAIPRVTTLDGRASAMGPRGPRAYLEHECARVSVLTFLR